MSRIPKSLQRPDQILKNPHGSLNRIYQQSRELLAVEAAIRDLLPDNVRVASLKNRTLHLVTASSATASQILYRRRNIITAARNRHSRFDIRKIEVSVRPEDPEFQPVVKPPSPLSAENARHLSDTAQYIEDDRLRKALIKLSRRGE